MGRRAASDAWRMPAQASRVSRSVPARPATLSVHGNGDQAPAQPCASLCTAPPRRARRRHARQLLGGELVAGGGTLPGGEQQMAAGQLEADAGQPCPRGGLPLLPLPADPVHHGGQLAGGQ